MTKYKLKTGNVGKVVTDCYKRIENGTVVGYRTIENVVVKTYNKIESKFVERFLEEPSKDVNGENC